MKKILAIMMAVMFVFSGEYAFAGGSMAPYIRVTGVDRAFGVSSAPNILTVAFCNNDHNVVSRQVKMKLQTKAVRTNGKSPKKSAKKTINYTTTANLDANSCGWSKITVKNGLFNVKVKIKEQEGESKWTYWTAWSSSWTTQ